jgi:hypothetical protein
MLINQDQLAEWCGYERASDIKQWLDKNHIKWLPSRNGRVCTTLAWIQESKEEAAVRIAQI